MNRLLLPGGWCEYDPEEDPYTVIVDEDKRKTVRFSNELCDLIEQCVSYSPDDRPSFEKLLEAIQYPKRPSPGHARAQRLRNANPADRLWPTLAGSLKDKWAIGSKLSRPKAA